MKIVHGTLQDFHRYWRDAPWAEPQFAAYMDAGKAEFWYARIGLRVVGRVYLFRELPDADAADGIKRAYLCNLHVLERYRGREIGSALLNRMADRAKELGFLELSIGVEEENDANMRLYQRMGYLDLVKSVTEDLICVKNADGNSSACGAYLLMRKEL